MAKFNANLLKDLKGRAQKILKNAAQLNSLVQSASKKAQKNQGVLTKVFDDLKCLLRLLAAYAKGDYRKIQWESIVIAVCAILYFVNPLDLVPDFLLGGFVDDTMVLGSVFSMLKSEIEAFKDWEKDKI